MEDGCKPTCATDQNVASKNNDLNQDGFDVFYSCDNNGRVFL